MDYISPRLIELLLLARLTIKVQESLLIKNISIKFNANAYLMTRWVP